MIQEVAEIRVKPGMEAEFEAGVLAAAPLFARAKGGGPIALHRVIEQPSTYRLVAEWASVDAHMVDFRNSPDFHEWRRLVGHCFDGAPSITHQAIVIDRVIAPEANG
jgi:quinol monooxygenase YgiN